MLSGLKLSPFIVTLFIGLTPLTLYSQNSMLPGVVAFSEQDMLHLAPTAFLDTLGFNIQKGKGFFPNDLDVNESMSFPMFPVMEKSLFSSKMIGLYIPGKYLELPQVRPGVIMIGNFNRTEKSRLAEYQIQKMGLTPFYANGNLLALDPSVKSIKIGYEYTLGFSLGLGFNSKETLNLVEKNGINLADSFTNIVQAANNLMDGPQAEKTLNRILNILPYLHSYMSANNSNEKLKTEEKAIRRSELKNIQTQQVNLPFKISKQNFPAEMQSLKDSLLSNIEKEIDWKSQTKSTVESMKIWDNIEGNQLVQSICDELASAYDMPIEIWPTCRIQATLNPNAFAFPGGDIFITAGLLGLLEDIDAVKHVLGHELGHVIARHTTHRMHATNAANMTVNVMALVGNLFSISGGAGQLGKVTMTNWFGKSMASSQIYGLGMNVATKGIILGLMAHSRSNEMQSDRIGQQLALFLGSDNNSIRKGWDDFMGFFAKYYEVKEDYFAQLFRSHPSASERSEGIQRRYPEYSKLNEFTVQNKSSIQQIESNKKIHSLFNPMVHEYGQHILNKKKTDSRSSKLTLWSMFSPGSQCALHALAPEHLK